MHRSRVGIVDGRGDAYNILLASPRAVVRAEGLGRGRWGPCGDGLERGLSVGVQLVLVVHALPHLFPNGDGDGGVRCGVEGHRLRLRCGRRDVSVRVRHSAGAKASAGAPSGRGGVAGLRGLRGVNLDLSGAVVVSVCPRGAASVARSRVIRIGALATRRTAVVNSCEGGAGGTLRHAAVPSVGDIGARGGVGASCCG